jgi:Uma2 family endonuclease
MGTPAGIHRYTFADYLDLEQASNVKHEFLGGEIYAMAGGTPAHAALSVAVASALLNQLRGGPCHVYSSDLRVRVLATGLATYPDVTVVCGDPRPDPDSAVTTTNPRVVVEVLSNSTIDYDRGEKLAHYQRIPALQAVVLIWQSERRIELHHRAAEGGWTYGDAHTGGKVTIEAIAATLDVDAIYTDALGE